MRVLGEGQWRVDDSLRAQLQELDEQVSRALDAGDEAALRSSLVALADIVYMAESAHLADPHVALGLVAADGGPITWPLLMTWVEQAVGRAALDVSGAAAARDADDVALKIYLYSRAQSVMGGTAQIQRNLIARRILGLPTT